MFAENGIIGSNDTRQPIPLERRETPPRKQETPPDKRTKPLTAGKENVGIPVCLILYDDLLVLRKCQTDCPFAVECHKGAF